MKEKRERKLTKNRYHHNSISMTLKYNIQKQISECNVYKLLYNNQLAIHYIDVFKNKLNLI